MLKFILLDIEGTTTPIDFVHKTLFPYSTKFLPGYIKTHSQAPQVRECLEAAKATMATERGVEPASIDDTAAIAGLLSWIAGDRKHGALKTLQGFVWRDGYADGSLRSVVYPDVAPCLRQWRQQGLALGIYSSGSVAAQKLLFAHTPVGDLNALFTAYFDTQVGGKRESASYAKILSELMLQGPEMAFLSDVEAELDAAKSLGVKTIQVVRPGTLGGQCHPCALDFPAATLLLGLG